MRWGQVYLAFAFVLILGAGVIFFSQQNFLIGKVISEPNSEPNVEAASEDYQVAEPGSVCENNECNPSNIQEICSNNEWARCGEGEVCSLGACVKPKQINRVILGGGDSGSSGESSTTQASAPAPIQENVINIGEIEGSIIQQIGENEKIVFSVNGTEHSIRGESISSPIANMSIDGKSAISITIGNEQFIDFESNGANDLSIILKSISLTTKRAKILLTEQ